jgi:hypothetical protein
MVADITIRALRLTHKSALSQKRSATHPHTQRWLPSGREGSYRRRAEAVEHQSVGSGYRQAAFAAIEAHRQTAYATIPRSAPNAVRLP